MTRRTSPEQVRAAIAGDAKAVERLISVVWPSCYRLAASAIGDLDLAQDAAQEACAIVCSGVRRLRDAEAFDTWLYRIVMREALRVRRKHGSGERPEYELSAGQTDTVASIDVWRALGELPPELRDVTVLFYMDDLTSAEISAVLKIPHATVRTRLARARARLRPLLDDRPEAHANDLEGSERHAY